MFEDEKEVAELIKSITHGGKPLRHKYYDETVIQAEQMGVHVEGKTPAIILHEKRPNEPEDVRNYRLKIWKNVTESLSGKVLHTISKIFDPKLFRVKFPENPSIVPENESLENYLNENFGIYKSIWVFVRETLLTKEMSDANSLCVVMPQNPDAEENEFFEPIPFIFPAKYLVDFVEYSYYILWIPKDHHKNSKKGELWIITDESIRVYFTDQKNVILKMQLPTGGFLPAFRLGGVVQGERSPYWYKSFINGVQPHWDKVVAMVSDLDGSIVNHLFPTPWEWQVECNTCGGKGTVDTPMENVPAILGATKDARESVAVRCKTCEGTGRITSKSPYGGYSVKRDALDPDLPAPIPPAGFITKDIEPIRELRLLKDEEILKGFEAINMEVVHRVGENQSGVAKTIDRADLDSMLMRIAQHVFDCNIEPIIKYTAIWRYKEILSPDALQDYIDDITVSKPKEFSVIGINMLMEELKAASASNVSSNYLRTLEKEIIETRFSNNEREKKKNLSIIELKPFPNLTDDQVAMGVANKTIKPQDAIRNTYIDELVTLAVENDEDFLDMEFSDKLTTINGLISDQYLEDEIETLPVEEGEEAIEEENEIDEDELEQELGDGGEIDEP